VISKRNGRTNFMENRRIQTKGLLVGTLLGVLLGLGGCNDCEKLTEKVCAELGKDCELWKEIGGPDQITPRGRKVNRACGDVLDNELAFEGLVTSARGTVLVERLQRATAKKDQAEIDKVKAEIEENKKRIAAGLEKVKNQVGR
jgi:hypothetical protein